MFQKLLKKINRWASRTEIKAVNEKNSIQFLSSLGIIHQATESGLICLICEKPIELNKWEILGCLNGEYVFCCSNSECLKRFIKLFEKEYK